MTRGEFERLVPVAKSLGQAVSNCLKIRFSDKQFYVCASLRMRDSMIIRFHQKWENEEPYYVPVDEDLETEKLFVFET